MSLFRSTLWLISAELVFTLSSYIVGAALGRLLGPADYGRYSLVIGFTTMIIIFVGRSVPSAMAKRLSEHAGNAERQRAIAHTTAWLQGGIIALLTLAFYAAAPLVARVFADPSLTPLFHLSAFIIPAFALSSFHVLLFNGHKRFGAMTVMKMARGLFRIAWIVGLAAAFGLRGALHGAIIAPLCVFGVALLIDVFWTPRPQPDVRRWRFFSLPHPPGDILTYAGGFLLFTLFYEFYVRTDIYLIKFFLHSDALTGTYNAAMTVALIPYYALFALALMLFPTISTRAAAGNTAGTRRLVTTVLRFTSLLLIPAGILLAFFATPLVTLFFGDAFARSGALVPLMLGGTVFGTFFYILAAVLNGGGYTRVTATITALAILVSIVANALYLPRFGISAAAGTFSATSFFMGAMALLAVRHLFGARIPLATLLRGALAGAGTALLVWLFSAFTTVHFLITSALALLVYGALLVLLRELTPADIAHFSPRKK